MITEGKEQFLYVTGYQQLKNFAKLTLKGELVWEKRAPMDSKLYPADEDTKPAKHWGRDAFMPTNYAFLPDGGFFLADGYASDHIFKFDKAGKYLMHFGTKGNGLKEFNTAHGMTLDTRYDPPRLLICDRNHEPKGRLLHYGLDGQFIEEVATGLGMPTSACVQGEHVSVPDLHATLLHQLGLDHNQLTFTHHGRPETPTDAVVTDARVVGELLSSPPVLT